MPATGPSTTGGRNIYVRIGPSIYKRRSDGVKLRRDTTGGKDNFVPIGTVVRRGQRATGPRSDVYFTHGELWHDIPPAQATKPRAQLVKPSTNERDFHLYSEPYLRYIISEDGDRAELKWNTGFQALAQGVGQLLLTRAYEGDEGRNFLVVPREPAPEYVEAIKQLDVILWVIPFP